MTAEAAKFLRRTAIVALLFAILAAGAMGAEKSRADAPVLGTAEPNYLYASDSKRRFLLKETKRAGAGLVRLNAFWFMVAPNEPLSPRDPGDPRYDFRQLDAAVREADKRGLDILMTLQRAPLWAESEPNSEDRGAWKPDVSDFGDYAHAVATRYSGDYGDPYVEGATLPRVRYFQAWNEGNLEKFYAPQRVGGESVSADRYRRLLNNAYDELKAVDPDNQVVVAGTGPRGPSEKTRTAPAEWWRDLLCLKQRNNKPKRKGCKPAQFDVFDHHPITVENAPTHRGRNGEVFIADFHKLSRLLNIAEREDTVGGPRNHEEWATEIYWETDPPETRRGYPEKKAARFLEQGIYLLAKQKVDLILNFFMIDAPLTTPGDVTNVQGGLLNVKRRRKDSFTAFRFPFVTDERKKGKTLAWGIAPRDGRVRIERLAGRRTFREWRGVTAVKARKGEIFKKNVSLRGEQKVRARIGGDKSLVWEQK